MSTRVDLSPSLRFMVISAALVILVAGLRAGAPVLIPLALAMFIAVVSLPALAGFLRLGVPAALAILLVVLLDAGVIALLGWVMVRSAVEIREQMPAYLQRFHDLEGSLLELLRGWGADIDTLPYANIAQPERLVDLFTTLLFGVTGAVSLAFLVLLFVIFILGEATGFPEKLRLAFGGHTLDLARYAPMIREVQQYLALKTLISLVTGLLIFTFAALFGVDFALLWGLLAFLLNFIPNIGSILAAVPAVTVALLQLGPGVALALAAVYLLVNVVLGNLVEPAVMGRRLGLSTLMILLSLVFWGWVWGVAGMFLSVPLTMAVKIALENTREFRWIAVLMGPTPAVSTPAAASPVIPAEAGTRPASPPKDAPSETG